ncbi:MAG TPA: TadE/TadG family type IV pilus assembly protein [Streptosporangiaceae bacterium]|nr:TadE/TadG family type IV pilus assembly protein [Streptosporangiaceae bacterium]
MRRGSASERPSRRDSGALILSYVIVMPVFLTALMFIAQASLWFLARSAALAAARQGVDAARIPGSSTAAGQAAALQFAQRSASGFLLSPGASAAGSTATTITITVRGQAPSIVPGIPIDVTQVAQAPVERFTTP